MRNGILNGEIQFIREGRGVGSNHQEL